VGGSNSATTLGPDCFIRRELRPNRLGPMSTLPSCLVSLFPCPPTTSRPSNQPRCLWHPRGQFCALASQESLHPCSPPPVQLPRPCLTHPSISRLPHPFLTSSPPFRRSRRQARPASRLPAYQAFLVFSSYGTPCPLFREIASDTKRTGGRRRRRAHSHRFFLSGRPCRSISSFLFLVCELVPCSA